MGQSPQKWLAAPAAAGVVALVVSASAQAELAATAEAGVGHSDNIRRVQNNETSETIGTAGLALDWYERTRRLRGDATVDLRYLDYLDNTYNSEVVGTANGTLAFGIVPETLQWVVQDSFGQAQTDPFAPTTPGNRENLNYFSTGPDLTLRFGSNAFGRVFGRWSATSYETSPLDAKRTTAGVALGRNSSARSELTLNAVTEKVNFDNAFNPDFDRDSLFVGWRLDASRTLLNAEVGYTWLDRDGSGKTGSTLANVSVTRDLSAASVLQLTLGSQLGDAGDALRSQLNSGPVGGAGQITATSDPFKNRLASLEWRYSRGRSGFSLGTSWSEDEYEVQRQFDRTRHVFNASFTRRLSSYVDLEIRAALEKEDFKNVDFDTDETRLAATVNWHAWRALGLRLLVERYDRNTSSNTGEFKENRAFLTLTYALGATEPTGATRAPRATRPPRTTTGAAPSR